MATIKQYCSVNFSLIFICVQIITTTKAQWAVDDARCSTTGRGIGSCIPIRECKFVIGLIRNAADPLTPEFIRNLRSYQCGMTEESSIKVCCPTEPNIKSEEHYKPPDISNHTNLNLLPLECGTNFSSSRILGGSQTYLYEYPWMALLSYETESGSDFRCGGTIINEWYILTAAHCLTNRGGLQLKEVRVGEYNISSDPDCQKEPFKEEICAPAVQDIAISEVIPHPLYNSTSYNSNIGLIRLASPIDLSVANAKTICLPVTSKLRETKFTDYKLRLTGWGSTETGRKHDILQKADLPVLFEESCRKLYEKFPGVINSKQICAGGRHRTDSCIGDSGGPLTSLVFHNKEVRYAQFAIVSTGTSLCGQGTLPVVYTRIDAYMDWILDNMKP